ncbi:hypothetical protein [Ramlibacter sp. AN1133]|uniref:hypothetical protein n=1 Tax=Ramlibacter sp. AN1133 TaxID=3133429 RepID=UPI0030C462DC
MSGVAAKGVLAGGIVTAHAVRADGTISAEALATASAPTDASGRYTVRFVGVPAQPYVIKVTVPQGGATHRDEATGQTQSLPPGFAMRAVVVPATATITANVTPFSEMAAEAAEDAGITADSARQANHTIKSMLGITAAEDLTAVPVKSTADASSADEQRLAVMLTAVSQMALDAAAGCSGDAGARAQCVVETLANATTSTSSYALSGAAAGALGTALRTVLATPTLVGNVPPAVLAPAVAALECEGVACNAPAPAAALDADGAIGATKTLFTEIRSDVAALFGGADATQPGALNLEQNKFGAAMSGVQVPAQLLQTDLDVLMTGFDLYSDFKTGRSQSTYAYSGPGYCYVLKDSQGTLPTAAADANVLQCSAYMGTQFVNNVPVDTMHQFVIQPAVTGDTWTYTARAQKITYNPNATQPTVTQVGQVRNGTITATRNANGQTTDFAVGGEVPATFRSTGQVDADHSAWNIRGTRAIDAANPSLKSISAQGSIVSKNAGGDTLGTLQIKSATFDQIPVAIDGNGRKVAPSAARPATAGDLANASLDVQWTVTGAEFEGTFAATGSTWDKSGTKHIPTQLMLQGRLANIASGVKTDFFQGKLSVVAAGYEQQEAQKPVSETNFYTLNATLSAQVTAPNRPLLAVSFGTSLRSFEDAPKSATLAYRSFAGGTPRMAITVDATRDAQGVATVTLAETTKGISMSVREDAASADVMLRGATKIGVLDVDTGVMTFTDGSFVSAF